MAITLGKKSMEVDKLFTSAGLSFKPVRINLEASETPKETVINLEINLSCELKPLERKTFWEKLKGLFNVNS